MRFFPPPSPETAAADDIDPALFYLKHVAVRSMHKITAAVEQCDAEVDAWRPLMPRDGTAKKNRTQIIMEVLARRVSFLF